MRQTLQDKINYSINLLKRGEKLALQMDKEGYHLAFSGGKDSMVLYHLAKEAGVKFHAEMQLTTIDPPELMRFVRRIYPDVKLNRPEINFYKLIEKKKMLPLRFARYCCACLKEQSGSGTVTLIGIRAAESSRRAKRNEVEIKGQKGSTYFLDQFNRDVELSYQCLNEKNKVLMSPILNWLDSDIWDFIKDRKLEYCELYDKGFHRIGCIFCPMASVKRKALERKLYPGVEREIKKSIQFLIDTNGYGNKYNATADELFDWWCSNKSAPDYFLNLRQQMKINF